MLEWTATFWGKDTITKKGALAEEMMVPRRAVEQEVLHVTKQYLKYEDWISKETSPRIGINARHGTESWWIWIWKNVLPEFCLLYNALGPFPDVKDSIYTYQGDFMGNGMTSRLFEVGKE